MLDQSIQNKLEEGDIVVHSNKLSYLPSFYFDKTMPQGFILDPVDSNVDTLSPATRKILNLQSFEDIESGTADASRVWFIIYQQSIDEFKSRGFETHPDIKYLNASFALTSVENFDDVRLYLYTRSAP
jgi:hypothetical protein